MKRAAYQVLYHRVSKKKELLSKSFLGPGRWGKTTLALQIAEDLIMHIP